MNIARKAFTRQAGPADFSAIIKLLQGVDLPTADISPNVSHFFVVEEEGHIIATAGLEIHDNFGLLRSVAVDKDHRNRSLATMLVDKLLSYASDQKIGTIYLITTTAEQYFAKKGFQTVNRNNVPLSITSSSEFSMMCPSTATVMMKSL